MGFVGGRGGGGRKPKPSKVGSKVRRANKKAAEQGPRDAEMLVPGGGKAGAEGVDLETVDWDKVGGWSKVKYDPNRLIFGAQEEGFVELEEIDMNDLDLSSLVPAANAVGRTDAGASKRGRPGEDHPESFALRDSEDDEPASLREKKADEKKRRDDAANAETSVETGEKRRAKQNANAEKGSVPPSLSAKEARVEKRKARWMAKVEAAKAKKAAARAEAGGSDPENANAFRGSIERRTTTGKLSTDDARTTTPRDVPGTASAPTAAATGSAKDAGWQMDYNNYPTSGFGAVVDGVDLDVGADVSNWLEFDLHPKLLRALQDMGFTTPTPIQREALNPAIKGRCDVIGAAETGSGKTLAFGLPILHRLLTQMDAEADDDSGSESGSDADANDAKGDEKGDGKNARGVTTTNAGGTGSDSESDPFANVVDETGRSGAGAGFELPRRRKALRALIITPTRELAMQVCDMLKQVAKHAPEIGITPVVGGMSLQKQERLLRRRPEVVVATPGRLWELMHQQGHEHFLDLGRLNFLVLDEADRMVERGHFAELHNIIDILPMPPRVKRPPGAAKATPETLKVFKKRGPAPVPANAGKRGGKGMKGGNADPDRDGDIVLSGHVPEARDIARAAADDADGAEISLRPSQMLDRQTFVFSATLTVPESVRRKLKRGTSREARDGKKEKGNETKGKGDKASHTLSGLMEAVPFYGRVKLVDLTDQSRTVAERVAESAAGVHGGACFSLSLLFFFFARARKKNRTNGRDASAGITPALPS
jgi:ATP-dependent RNA helicase DDX24/MAK5